MEAISEAGPFAVGSVFGAVLFWLTNWQAGKERNKESEIRMEREKELYNQLHLKDERINELHKELHALSNLQKTKPTKTNK